MTVSELSVEKLSIMEYWSADGDMPALGAIGQRVMELLIIFIAF